MRILFAASGLETGKDGVGDYTRSLAEECVRQGHRCSLASLNDRHVAAGTATEGSDHPESIPTLRSSASEPWSLRIERMATFCAKFEPDWVSLQFVCYGFHPRGLIGRLDQTLSPLLGGRRLHVMIHELWVMHFMKCRLRDRMVGLLQRQQILAFLRKIQPAALHTSIPLYQSILRESGFTARQLSLIGNIPICKGYARIWLSPHLENHNLGDFFTDRASYYAFGFFGTIADGWDFQPFLNHLRCLSSATGRKIVVFSIGEAGARGRGVFERMRQDASPEISSLLLGRESSSAISQFLQTIDFGVSTYSEFFFGKSSAGATMVEHGLTVVVAQPPERVPRRWQGAKWTTNIITLDDDFVRNIVKSSRMPAQSQAPGIAREFLLDLASPVESPTL